ncbi:MAG: EI24 domain-containing protein [Saprospiraceae bacterium]|nr:EI24 domain-containing protein [Saprospiraceae bacterium]MCF8252571.1 EI24 domain-containing protein [Saprospiraceae bacterium]MCF8282612.1 EI24 domain-containing protein [Bacteroidales bacterium]MCF8314157.1 EI24 domain-containing protein [Saprospiraceae bacterium]MCF8442923.1 EI24 domain-containing protein [Saprospiraceae bacterium]
MLKNFFEGISTYGTAIKHVNAYGLWKYILLPGLLSILLGIGIFSLAWSLSDNIGDIIDNLWKWDWGSNVVAKISQVFGGLLVFLLGMIVFKQLVMVVSAPIMSVLSEKVERQLLGRETSSGFSIPGIIADIVRGLKIALRNIFRELGATLLLLLLSLIPIFAPFTAILIFVVQAFYAGFGNLDFTLERHFRFRESVNFVQKNRWLAIGNGAVFMLLLYTFVGFLFALPLGTVAATIAATKRLEDKY